MRTPKVSVIIPLYNRQKLVQETLTSLEKQQYANWEAVIVDDGSSDQSYQVVEEWVKKDQRFRLFRRNREPKGAPTCRNIGLEKSTGELIVYLDSDDLLAEHCLQQRTRIFAQHPSCDFLVFSVQFFNKEPGDRSAVWLYQTEGDILSAFLLKAQWGTTSTIWRKETLIRLGGFDERLIKLQDSDLHRRALISGLDYIITSTPVDAYHRQDSKHSRISGRESNLRTTQSNEYAFFKIYYLLLQSKLATDFRKEIIAGHLLSVALDYVRLDQKEKALDIWKEVRDKKMVNTRNYQIVNFYLVLQTTVFRRLTGFIRPVFRWVLPKYLLWHA